MGKDIIKVIKKVIMVSTVELLLNFCAACPEEPKGRTLVRSYRYAAMGLILYYF